MNNTKIELKPMNQKENLLHHLINEINEVKCHLCNSRQFEGGFALGELQRSLYNILEKELNNPKKKETGWEDDEEEKDKDDDELPY